MSSITKSQSESRQIQIKAAEDGWDYDQQESILVLEPDFPTDLCR